MNFIVALLNPLFHLTKISKKLLDMDVVFSNNFVVSGYNRVSSIRHSHGGLSMSELFDCFGDPVSLLCRPVTVWSPFSVVSPSVSNGVQLTIDNRKKSIWIMDLLHIGFMEAMDLLHVVFFCLT